MRTTININDNIYNAAKNHAHMTGQSIGDVISEWANRGLNVPIEKPTQDIKRNPLTGFPVFKGKLVKSDFNNEDVRRLEEQEDKEKYGKFFT